MLGLLFAMPSAYSGGLGSSIISTSIISVLLIIGIIVVVNILILKFIAWAVTNTVLDVLEKRGYGKGVWKR